MWTICEKEEAQKTEESEGDAERESSYVSKNSRTN